MSSDGHLKIKIINKNVLVLFGVQREGSSSPRGPKYLHYSLLVPSTTACFALVLFTLRSYTIKQQVKNLLFKYVLRKYF